MANIRARKPGGAELSGGGALTNPAFTLDASNRVMLGDTATIELYCDAEDYLHPSYTVPGVSHVAYSADGVTWGAEGADIVIGEVGYAGTALHLKAASTTASLGTLVLPQDGIVQRISLGTGTDSGEGTDSGSLTPVVPVGTGTDSGEGTDSGSLALDNVIDLGAGIDSGEGTDAGSLAQVVPLGAGTDSGVGTDSGALAEAPLNVTADIDTLAYSGSTSGARRLTRLTGGNLIAVYEKTVTGIDSFAARSANDGAAWTALDLNAVISGNVQSPTVAALPDGTAAVAYSALRAAGTYTGIFAGVLSDGGASFSGAEVFADAGAVAYSSPSLAIDASGNWHMVWESGANGVVYYAKRTSGTWGTKETVASFTAHASTRPRPNVAIAPNGDIWCTYMAYDGTNHQIIVEKRGASAWDTAPIVAYSGAALAYSPQVAFDGDGYLHLTYEMVEGASSKYAAKYQRSTTTTPTALSTAITLSDEAAYDQRNVQFGIDASGHLTVLWNGCHAGSTTYTQINARACTHADPTDVGNWNAIAHLTTTDSAKSQPQVLAAPIPADGYTYFYFDGASVNNYTVRYVATNLVWQGE